MEQDVPRGTYLKTNNSPLNVPRGTSSKTSIPTNVPRGTLVNWRANRECSTWNIPTTKKKRAAEATLLELTNHQVLITY